LKTFNIEYNEGSIVFDKLLDDNTYQFHPEDISLEPIKVELVYQPAKDKKIHLAWKVSVYTLDAQNWYVAKINASTGKLINYHNNVVRCNFDHACKDESHDHSHISNLSFPGPDTVNANAYNVYPTPIASPNHGNSALVFCPEDSVASPFGWHDTDGVEGAEFTITRGNNAHAYNDVANLNRSIGDEPDGGDSLYFNFQHDPSNPRPFSQADASVVNLFYWNNILHDYSYHYGFDEPAGNFQANNYGNGGAGNDWLRAEALDGSATNNAVFGSGADGTAARMQMFYWGNQNLPDVDFNSTMSVSQPADIVGDYDYVAATFGSGIPEEGITGSLVLVEDGTAPINNGCEDLLNADDINGDIALFDRGQCQFGFKGLAAQNAGAIAYVVCQNEDAPPFAMIAGDFGGSVTIPGIMLSRADCDILKMNLNDNQVTVNFPSVDVDLPGPVGRSSDLDNVVIAHEYAHGISSRLTGGPSVGFQCLSSDEQQGEGWSDFFGLILTTTSANTAEEARGIGTFAAGQATTGRGIRSFPYTRDMDINPHTYNDILGESVPHGVGSVWCVMIWDLYWNLVDEYGYDDNQINGTGGNNIAVQLVMDGMKLQPCNPDFVSSRDAIIAADIANNEGRNVCLIWETFARRGLGEGATPGGNESFEVPETCNPLKLEKVAVSEASAGDTITYRILLINNLLSLDNNSIFVDSFPSGAEYVEGSLNNPVASVDNNVLSIDGSSINLGDTILLSYKLAINTSPFSILEFEDEVENGTDEWEVESAIGDLQWRTNRNSFEGDFAWFAQNIDSQCDQYLSLASPVVLNRANPVLIFQHSYDTESTWDGGVVEISTNNGGVWDDLGEHMIQNGYPLTIRDNPASPLSLRRAFTGASRGFVETVVDLSDFINEEVLIRFRFGCDAAVGGDGWYIDNIQIFDNYHFITNIACLNFDNEMECDAAKTVIFNKLQTSDRNEILDLEVNLFPNPTADAFTLQLATPNQS
ncbi:MAG: M36 family metallopeptidase, partial [Bacteroidota bacterium]